MNRPKFAVKTFGENGTRSTHCTFTLKSVLAVPMPTYDKQKQMNFLFYLSKYKI